jgi:hypothetical protein
VEKFILEEVQEKHLKKFLGKLYDLSKNQYHLKSINFAQSN